MPRLRLTYFDSPGRAESIRIVLRLAGLPFEDRRLSFPQFAALKAEGAFPLGSVPVLEVDGLAIPQTAAILRYVARLGDTGLHPREPYDALLVDSVLDTFNDTLTNALLPSLFERDMDRKLAMRAEFSAGPMRRCFDLVERLLGRHDGPFVLGEAMSIADVVVALQVAQIRRGGLDGIPATAVEAWPRLVRLADAFEAEPRIVALRAG